MKSGLELIAEERNNQLLKYTVEHDDAHNIGELANAASCYAMIPAMRPAELPPSHYPWIGGWNPTPQNRIKELTKAGALIVAEIERIQRKEISLKQSTMKL